MWITKLRLLAKPALLAPVALMQKAIERASFRWTLLTTKEPVRNNCIAVGIPVDTPDNSGPAIEHLPTVGPEFSFTSHRSIDRVEYHSCCKPTRILSPVFRPRYFPYQLRGFYS